MGRISPWMEVRWYFRAKRHAFSLRFFPCALDIAELVIGQRYSVGQY